MGTCTQQCVPIGDGNLTAFMIQLWSGPEGTTPPACPAAAPGKGSGYLDTPPATVSCSPACTCYPSVTACGEVSALTASMSSCPAGAGSAISLPLAWDGTCVATSPVSQVSSLTTGRVDIGQAMCVPANVKAASIKDGKTRAIRCSAMPSIPDGRCPDPNDMCAYKKVDGFHVCLLTPGDIDCPTTGWSEKHLFFDDEDACTCTCGPSSGDSCTTTVKVFGDGACTMPLGSTTVSSSAGACFDIAPGSKVAGVSATLPSYQAGSCAPMLEKSPVSTACCLP